MAVNIHVRTDEDPPEGWSEARKVVALVRFWKKFMPEVRANIIKGIESQPHYMFDTLAGIEVATLKLLEKIDDDKLVDELRALLKEQGYE